MPQKTEQRIWKIIEFFYKSLLALRQIHDEYERKAAGYCADGKHCPEDLRLSPSDLAGLLEYQELEQLRDRFLWPLKEYCHTTFRGRDQTDLLDRYVSDIFHEVSILKEELYTVEHYAPFWAKEGAQHELESIMEEAARLFPQKVHHVAFLFRMALERLENLLPLYRDHKILVRSLFLNRHGFVSECYPTGIEHFYHILYPEVGPLGGYEKAGISFFESGFFQIAGEAFEEGLAYGRREEKTTPEKRRILESMASYAEQAKEHLAKREQVSADTEPAAGG
jgi:hypothetical protein